MKTIKTCVTALISALLVFSPVAYADKWSDQFPHIKATGDIPGECSYESMSKKNYKGKTLKINTHAVPVMGEPTALHAEQFAKLTGAKVDVKDTGEVTVAAPDEASRNKAIEFIKNLIAKPEMGKVYKGKVVKIMEFGAFVNFLGKQDGLVHISELADKRVAKVGDVVKEGDEVSVKVVGFDRGKVKLSMKQVSA